MIPGRNPQPQVQRDSNEPDQSSRLFSKVVMIG